MKSNKDITSNIEYEDNKILFIEEFYIKTVDGDVLRREKIKKKLTKGCLTNFLIEKVEEVKEEQFEKEYIVGIIAHPIN